MTTRQQLRIATVTWVERTYHRRRRRRSLSRLTPAMERDVLKRSVVP
ncbi:hypothetical protein Strop_1164 [Salinispora tropica CNB-440]|uniref:Integrase, catalytic region n=1 Tax=Salinispora tropica (strain ATCC BAA-916 / DSM 44818 / JCM 13857 / NBRC 105044 / CNB-440) TaxID=369723 RepID=A4X434_SALTO|nr:hypothetical protein Strop_1164 [Salinispora tropica CNB-440]